MSSRYQKITAPQAAASGLLPALVARGGDFSWFGGSGSRWLVVPLLRRAAAWDDFEAYRWDNPTEQTDETLAAFPFTNGYCGVIPYEKFSTFESSASPLLSAADAALLYDQEKEAFFVVARDQEHLACARHEADDLLEQAEIKGTPGSRVTLKALEKDDDYEQKVADALKDIRNGRYYQINLLRYFAAGVPDIYALANLLVKRGGPWSAWIRQGSTDIISFSPEQFTSVQARGNQWQAVTRPIKGTAARHQDPSKDQNAAATLQKSTKDRAELHMIIDLMRNDLARISVPGSVRVTQSAELQSFVNVHHLVGQVEGTIEKGISARRFLEALCPAGSITGAPKIEVMQAIREAEGRPRGYFMGNAFLLDRSGRFDSSVLIRTMVRNSSGSGNEYEFSAGSGIVISSNPRSERLEINAKCNVLFPEE